MMEERRYDAAIATLQKVLDADPKNLLARRDLGVALIEKHDYTRAADELQRVVAASGDDYVTRYELGIAQEGLGHLRAAQAQFEFACRIAPGAQQCKDALDRVIRQQQAASSVH
jgi:tetratricopeptide (TPR) repeat protein